MSRLVKPPVSPTSQRSWSSLAVSAVVHLLLLVVAAGLSRPRPASEPPDRGEQPADRPRIDMIYVPPADPPPQPAPARPAPPPQPPAVRQTAPEPEPNAPPDAIRSSGAETVEEPKPRAGEPRAEPAAPAPAAKEAATLESEARRIFGRPRLMTRAGAGPQATRPMEAWLPNDSERCIPHPVAAKDSAGATQFGTVMGRIFRQDNGRPLAGAHLQMMGTPYVSFTDETGEYRFRFDLSLMDNCRTQYVKVTAAGYESRLLVLVVGPNRSEDVRLRRR